MLHGAELGQKFLALLVAAEGVDHPGRHVVDGDIGGGGGAALRQFLEDQRGVEPAERRAADVLLHVDAAEAERGRLAQRLDREHFALVPVARVRHHLVARERARGGLEGALLFGEGKVHPQRVTPGLDPGVHVACQRSKLAIMDCRVKPGNDSVEIAVKPSM